MEQMELHVIQTPSINVELFRKHIRKAVRVLDLEKGKDFDGILRDVNKESLMLTVVEWHSPMTGTSGFRETTKHVSLNDMIKEKVRIILL